MCIRLMFKCNMSAEEIFGVLFMLMSDFPLRFYNDVGAYTVDWELKTSSLSVPCCCFFLLWGGASPRRNSTATEPYFHAVLVNF